MEPEVLRHPRGGGLRRPRQFTSLNKLAEFFGVGAKTEGVSGKDFAKLWAEDHAKAVEYLSNDINLTVAVAKAMGLI